MASELVKFEEDRHCSAVRNLEWNNKVLQSNGNILEDMDQTENRKIFFYWLLLMDWQNGDIFWSLVGLSVNGFHPLNKTHNKVHVVGVGDVEGDGSWRLLFGFQRRDH